MQHQVLVPFKNIELDASPTRGFISYAPASQNSAYSSQKNSDLLCLEQILHQNRIKYMKALLNGWKKAEWLELTLPLIDYFRSQTTKSGPH